VLGHFKSERNDTTGSSRPVGLRGAGTYSVILGHFRNSGFDSDVMLAQVFWMKEGPSAVNVNLPHLTEAEAALYQDLVEDAIGPAVRLEQERISPAAVTAASAG
jgi:uncharacterized protein YPO0396